MGKSVAQWVKHYNSDFQGDALSKYSYKEMIFIKCLHLYICNDTYFCRIIFVNNFAFGPQVDHQVSNSKTYLLKTDLPTLLICMYFV